MMEEMIEEKYIFNGVGYNTAWDVATAALTADIITFESPAYIEQDNQVKYSAAQFIIEAYTYFKIPNLVQASEKLYLASVYTIKHYFLLHGINPCTHNAMRGLVKIAIDHSNLNYKHRQLLTDAWKNAQTFHSYAYGTKDPTDPLFKQKMDNVVIFTRDFPNLDEESVMDKIQEFMGNGFRGVFQVGVYNVNFERQEEASLYLGTIKESYTIKLW